MKNFNFHNLQEPIIMGILNLTPDSFYDGGSYHSELEVLKKVDIMLQEGASCIDIGAYSSRPDASHISEKEEIKRLLPTLKGIVKEFPKVVISIDTFRSEVAKRSIHEGASIINDISGGNMDDKMFHTIAELQVPYILMHMQGTPQTMQSKPDYTNVLTEVTSFFIKKIDALNKLGVKDIVLDVGFGFGKTIEQNYELLHNLKSFETFKKPILVGLSRKSMLYKALKIDPENALNATSVAHTIALLNGANILRVHDVKEAKEVITVMKYYNNKTI